MKDKIFGAVKSVFSSKIGNNYATMNNNSNKQYNSASKNIKETESTRIVSFEQPNKTQSRTVKMESDIQSGCMALCEEIPDHRYDKLENLPSLKELGFKGQNYCETVVMYENKLILYKLQTYKEIELTLTDYALRIRMSKNSDEISFQLGKIEKLAKYMNNENFYKLLIELKDGRRYKFRMNTQSIWKKVYEKIEKFSFILFKRHYFAFRFFEKNRQLELKYQGWKLYNPLQEFKRMGIEIQNESSSTQCKYDFKVLDNSQGRICSTYPAFLVVPSRISDDDLCRCSKFRSRCRMPALTYAYEFKHGHFATMYRSSQSRVGIQNSRSPEDELLLRTIGNHKLDPKGNLWSYLEINLYDNKTNCIIYDARGYLAALGNKVSGKGYQSEEYYVNCKVQFLNIPNIHSVRQSYIKVLKASSGEDNKFFNNLSQSQWYDYIFLILQGALDIAINMGKGINILVHCSDGWDRTAQLCSLASIILDPFYRTFNGFQILIQKDWIHFGHQFALRLSQGMNSPNSEERSQVFLQFLDCVSQLLYQFPTEFQYNYKYLQQIGQMAYTHLYGNFLCNNEMEMIKAGIQKKTVSLWSYVRSNKDSFINAYYNPIKGTRNEEFLNVNTAQKYMRFWKEHFLQHLQQFKDIYDIYSCKFTEDNLEIIHKQLKKQHELLREKTKQNGQQIANLITEINELSSNMDSNDQNGQNYDKQIQ